MGSRSGARSAPKSGGERGLATTELAFLTPLILFLIIGIAQGALWAHATAVAQAAADHGADVGSTYDAPADSGKVAAEAFALQAGGLNNPVAAPTTVTIGGIEQVTITVTGEVPSLVGPLSVQATSTSPREVVRP